MGQLTETTENEPDHQKKLQESTLAYVKIGKLEKKYQNVGTGLKNPKHHQQRAEMAQLLTNKETEREGETEREKTYTQKHNEKQDDIGLPRLAYNIDSV